MTNAEELEITDAEWRELAERDWVRIGSGSVLHAPGISDDMTECGRRGHLWIPGLFSRMSCRRCYRCCVLTGMPHGIGSPKNDDGCRAVVRDRLEAVGR